MASDPNSDFTPNDPVSPVDFDDPQIRLQRSEILERVSDAIIALDRDWRIIYANRRACDINQKSFEEFAGKTHWEEWPASVGSELERQYRRAMAEQVDVHFEHQYASPPYDVWLAIDAYPSEDGLHLFYHDITEQKQAHQKLIQSEERFRAAFAHAAVGMALTDLQGRFVLVNPAFSEITGYTEQEIRAFTFLDITHPDDRAEKATKTQQLLRGEIPSFVIEKRYVHRDGTVGWVQNSVSLVRNADGAPANMITLTEDITQRKAAIDATHEANQRSTDILESITDAFFALDKDWRFTYVNRQAEELLAQVSRDLVGKNIWEEFPAAVGTSFDREYHRAFEQQIAVSFEAYYPVPLDTWYEVRAYPTNDSLSVYFHDINERKRAEQIVQTAYRRTEEILESITDAFYSLDSEFRFTYTNRRTEETWGKSRAELLGKPILEVLPNAQGSISWVYHQQAMSTRRAVHYEAISPVIDAWVDVSIYPTQDGGLSVYYRDISERKRQDAALHDSEERLRLAIDGAEIGTWHWDIVTNKLAWSDTMYALLGNPILEEPTYDAFLAALHPADRDRAHLAITECLTQNRDYAMDFRVVWPDSSIHWQVARGRCYYDDQGNAKRMEGIAIDITNRKRAEMEVKAAYAREVALNKISQAIRQAHDPYEIQQIALSALAEALHVDRCLTMIVDRKRDTINFVAEWHRSDLSDLCGEYSLSQFDVELDALFPAASSLVVPDVYHSQLGPKGAAIMASMQIRALMDVPFAQDGKIVGALGVYMSDGPRAWTTDEVSFVEAVASQLRAATEASRLLQEAQARAERAALVNRIGEAIRSSMDPDVIQATAVNLLGAALHVDRCYFAIYDLAAGIVTVRHEWCRSDLPSIIGVHPFNNTREMFEELYKDSQTSVIPDAYASDLSAQTIANMRGLQLRSRVSVALTDEDGLLATLTASMADVARDWIPEEVELIESVATQMRSAVSLARVQQREHRIAAELQGALQPALPDHVPGLEIASYIKPALDEAAVGGDFFDVFALDKEMYAIVIGDVSGKGLAAAAQVATVRNMLRSVLYQYRNAAQATSNLNTILTAHDLLIGFVTAFVAIYDAGTGEITYASCGHELGLIRRISNGSIETLETTGPPLGAAENVTYGEASNFLAAGDSFMLYTDGLSEAGPNRLNLLGTQGLMRIFGDAANITDIQANAQRIVADASQYANGIFRDDVCVLLARRK